MHVSTMTPQTRTGLSRSPSTGADSETGYKNSTSTARRVVASSVAVTVCGSAPCPGRMAGIVLYRFVLLRVEGSDSETINAMQTKAPLILLTRADKEQQYGSWILNTRRRDDKAARVDIQFEIV